jgi:6-carboxyhexanoate--CoA ligase
VPFEQVERIPCLPVRTVTASDPAAALAVTERLLEQAGVALGATAIAFDALKAGLGPGRAALRGAALLDGLTGVRRDPDSTRGVRASHLDYSAEGRLAAQQALAEQGLTHFRTIEALAVASKVMWAGVLAEICWSDDPDYRPGYVATRAAGYVRFPAFKPPGAVGGRVFFVRASLNGILACVERLERRSVLIEPPVTVRPPVSVEGFMQSAVGPNDGTSRLPAADCRLS